MLIVVACALPERSLQMTISATGSNGGGEGENWETRVNESMCPIHLGRLPPTTVAGEDELWGLTYGHGLEAGFAWSGMRRWLRAARLTTNKTLGSRKTPPALKLVFAVTGCQAGGGAAGLHRGRKV